MNKNTYLLAIFFLVISFIAGIYHSILLLRQEFSLVFLQPYADWYLVFNIVALIVHGFMIRYFYFKQWQFVFYASSIAAVIFVVQVAFQYYIFITALRELTPQYTIVAIISIVSSVFLGCGLFFSAASHNKVLKWTGMLVVVTNLTLLGTIVAVSLGVAPEIAYRAILYLNAASPVFPLLFILVFKQELKTAASGLRPSSLEEGLSYGLGATGMATAVALLMLGGQLGKESYWNRDWQKRGPVEARKLAERFEARIYVNDQHDTLHYLFMRPLAYDSLQKYPIVTCLHGGPTRIAGNVEVTQPAPLLSEYTNRKKYPAFIFVPQGRPGVLWGGIPGVPSLESLVFEAMDELEKEFSIDESRRYVAGISGGGYGSWHFISTHPEKFAAAIPICGAGNPALAKQIVDIPVWAFHGDADRNVPVTGSRNMIEAIRQSGGNPRYNEFPNVGHNVWPEVEKTEGVLDWLFSQRKELVTSH